MLDVLFGLQSRADKPVTDDFWYNPIALPNSAAGVAVTEELSMTYSTVFACVNKIAKTVATLPVHVMKTLPDDKKERVPDHELAKVWKVRPNPEMTAVSFRECMMVSTLLWGNAYAEIVFTNGGKVAQLWPMLAREITMMRTPAPDNKIVYIYRPSNTGEEIPIPSRRMFHLVGLSFNGLLGLSVIAYHREAIGLGMGATQMGASLFGNMCMPGIVIQHPGPRRMSQPAYERLQKSINEGRQGSANAHKTMLLEEGATAEAIGIPPDDAQFLETRMFQRVDICGIFDVPPSKIGDDTRSTYCLPADVEVMTSGGPCSVADVAVGSQVWSLDTETKQWHQSRVLRSSCTGTDPILNIRTENRTVRANARHRILARRKYAAPRGGSGGHLCVEWKTEWVPAGELRVGDTIVQADGFLDASENVLPNGRRATRGFMEFCGLLLGDGNIIKGGVAIARTPRLPGVDYMAHYRKVMQKEFEKGDYTYPKGEDSPSAILTAQMVASAKSRVAAGETAAAIARGLGVHRSTVTKAVRGTNWKTQTTVSARSPIHLCEAKYTTGFSSVIAEKELRALGLGGTAKTKSVPQWVYGLQAELQLALLRGFLDADGSVNKLGRISFDSCNERMLSQFRHLCIGLGIPVTNVQHVECMATLPNGRQVASCMHRFTCSDPGANRRIWSHDPRYQARLNGGTPFCDKVRCYARYGGRGFGTEGCTLARIVSIKEEPAEPVFDLEVEGTHSFIANGVVVHNSNVEQKNIDYATDTVLPWCVRIESALDAQFLADTEYYVKHNLDGLKRGSFIERQEGYSFGRAGGWLSRNDIRRMEDMDPIPGGDDYLTPVNMVTLGEEPEPEPVVKQLPAPGGKQPFPPAALNRGTQAALAAAVQANWMPRFPKAFRPLFEDAMGRVLAKEKKALLNAWKKHAKGGTVETFLDWATGFYTEHEQYVTDALRPIFQVQPLDEGVAIAEGFAQRYVFKHLGEVRSTIANSPDLLSATVALWESEYFVDHLLELVA